MKSLAAVQVADEKFEFHSFALPLIGKDDALLRLEGCGICGSDVEQYYGKLASTVRYPVIPGHEPFGYIEEVGEDAARRWGVTKGDRVVVEPIISCGLCRECLSGSYNRCVAGSSRGYGYTPVSVSPALWGGYAEYMYLCPRTILHKVPADVPANLIAFCQPIAAGLRWTAMDAGTRPGDTVVILGAGQRGLASVIAAREAGAGMVIVTGLQSDSHKLEIAKELGADVTIVADRQDTVALVREITDGHGADVVVDVTAVSVGPVLDAIEIARPGGMIVLAGIKGDGRMIPNFMSDKLIMKELTVRGMLAQKYDAYEVALQVLAKRKYPIERMHTHTFVLEEVDLALRTAAGQVEGELAIHVMLMPKH